MAVTSGGGSGGPVRVSPTALVAAAGDAVSLSAAAVSAVPATGVEGDLGTPALTDVVMTVLLGYRARSLVLADQLAGAAEHLRGVASTFVDVDAAMAGSGGG